MAYKPNILRRVTPRAAVVVGIGLAGITGCAGGEEAPVVTGEPFAVEGTPHFYDDGSASILVTNARELTHNQNPTLLTFECQPEAPETVEIGADNRVEPYVVDGGTICTDGSVTVDDWNAVRQTITVEMIKPQA
ncbi:MAG TPA: hypothetical protein VK978_03440 [Candidatus Saccharimonadales bacterium]|nr:hypothetical protein [Candidatus Saccharimonadales bacterium]